MPADTEEDMVILFQQNDFGDLNKLFDKYAPLLLGLITGIVGNGEVGQNVLQISFARIWENRKMYDAAKERLFTWMYKIAKMSALKSIYSVNDPHKKYPGNEHDKVLWAHAKTGITTSDTFISFISLAPGEQQSMALELVYLKGYTLSQAAGRLNIPVDNLKSLVIRATKSLQETTVT